MVYQIFAGDPTADVTDVCGWKGTNILEQRSRSMYHKIKINHQSNKLVVTVLNLAMNCWLWSYITCHRSSQMAPEVIDGNIEGQTDDADCC